MTKALTDLRVLVVDDNPAAMHMMQVVLKGIGVKNIYTARDGQAGLAFLGGGGSDSYALDGATERVDLIVCDWKMPRMTGLELLCQVRMAHPGIAFMLVTGHADSDFIMAAKEFAVDGCLAKPYSPQECERKLRELIRKL